MLGASNAVAQCWLLRLIKYYITTLKALYLWTVSACSGSVKRAWEAPQHWHKIYCSLSRSRFGIAGLRNVALPASSSHGKPNSVVFDIS